MTRLLLLLPLLAMVACGSVDIVVANRLAPGGGEAGDGGSGSAIGPTLDIAVRIEQDATDFNPGDLLQLFVNGADRTDEVVIGGNYAVLRIDPAPVGNQFVELFRRTGPVLDTFTYIPQPFAGPTLTGVNPASAMAGAQVTISGTGFAGGALRVFFGGIEGTVDASDDSSITATVPSGARTGLVFVLVDAEAARGVIGFQLLDGTGADVPITIDERFPEFHGVMPGHGVVETVIRVYGTNLDEFVRLEFDGIPIERLFDVQDVDLGGIAGVHSALCVIDPVRDTGAQELILDRVVEDSNPLPFTIDAADG